ncbi:hypothetical protein HD599_001082 [Conyzicola lurida]|uniref:Ig-like domain-containing protein n=1 Tax=Conyzicola lurida TaxID=1172621 RepID=A0A841AMV5_9MICO|nr:hypothetical protein [Conyzicola lurida]MBB5842759.1 hypothetical protein [Conyzicola lurida]
MNSRLLRLAAATLAVGGLLAVSVTAARVEPTVASWRTDGYATTTLSTVKLNPVTSITCDTASGTLVTSVPIRWTAPALTGTGPSPDSYTLTATSGSLTNSTTVTGTTYSLGGVLLTIGGTFLVTVVANYTTSSGAIAWSSPVSTQRLRVTVSLGVAGIIVSYTCATEANP